MELENALAHERNHNSSSGAEAKELRIRVEDLRRKMAELEASNQSLGHKSSELQINLQEQASTYQSQVHYSLNLNIIQLVWFAVGGKRQGD